MLEKELAEIRERWAREAYWQFGGNAEYTIDQSIPLLPIEVSNKVYALIDQILNTLITKEGGVCPRCNGVKPLPKSSPALSTGYLPCPDCKGTGKLPDITKTLWEWVKLGMEATSKAGGDEAQKDESAYYECGICNGRNDVVEWIRDTDILIMLSPTKRIEWQAKLKEWNIKPLPLSNYRKSFRG